MVAPRVTYQIRVRDFRWRGGLRVQSPNIGRESDSARVIFRPLEGINLDEPRFTEGFAELQDDPDSGIYDADAHGVVVSDTSETHLCPVWVPVEHGAGKNADDEVCVVNLRTFRSSVVPIAKVCWVPGRRGPDGRLYTRIGSPYRSMGRNRAHLLTLVAVQIEGHPMETKIEVVASSELAEYSVIDEIQKELIFDRQYLVLHGFCQPGSADLRWRRLREDYLGTQEEDLLHLSEPSSDEDPAVDEMADVPPGPNNQVYSCQCRWPDLRPTLRNPCPLHRHNTDADCRLGSDHSTHCVFADHSPEDCVVSGSHSPPHEHCEPPPPSRARQMAGEELSSEMEMDLDLDLETLPDGASDFQVGRADTLQDQDDDTWMAGWSSARSCATTTPPPQSPGCDPGLGLDLDLRGDACRSEFLPDPRLDAEAERGPIWGAKRRRGASTTPEAAGIQP